MYIHPAFENPTRLSRNPGGFSPVNLGITEWYYFPIQTVKIENSSNFGVDDREKLVHVFEHSRRLGWIRLEGTWRTHWEIQFTPFDPLASLQFFRRFTIEIPLVMNASEE